MGHTPEFLGYCPLEWRLKSLSLALLRTLSRWSHSMLRHGLIYISLTDDVIYVSYSFH